MQIKMPGGELGQLGETAGDRQPVDRMGAQIFERAADKIAHVDQPVVGEIIEALHGALRGGARRRGDVNKPGGAGDIDATLDRMNP